MNTPVFHHDCDQCVFLGHVRINNGMADCYYCKGSRARFGESPDNARKTLIVRRSSDSPDYESCPANCISPLNSPEMNAALSLYVRKLGANGAKGLVFFKDKEIILDLTHLTTAGLVLL